MKFGWHEEPVKNYIVELFEMDGTSFWRGEQEARYATHAATDSFEAYLTEMEDGSYTYPGDCRAVVFLDDQKVGEFDLYFIEERKFDVRIKPGILALPKGE